MKNASALHTTQLILDSLRPGMQADAWTAVFHKQQTDWDDLVVRAIVLGLAPQVYLRLQAWGVKLPVKAMAKLAVTYKAQSRRNQAILAQLDELLAACAAVGIEPIALKGVHLAHDYYDDAAMRPMNDIDLLFAPAEMPMVEQVLVELGYGAKYKSAEMGAGVTKHTSTFSKKEGEETAVNPYLSADRICIVEPHISLEESWYGLKVDITPGIRERAQAAQLGQQPCRVLSPDDLLLHLCLHFCFHLIQLMLNRLVLIIH